MWLPDGYERAKTKFLSAIKISNSDKEAVIKLVDKLVATSIRKTRAAKYYIFLRLIIEREWLRAYSGITEDELYRCLSEIEHYIQPGGEELSGETKRDYKICIKRILEHLNNPLSKIIKTTSKSTKHLPKFYLTPQDILNGVKSNHIHFRNKAMFACFYESNCRPHEFFLLKREDVRFDILPAKLWDGNGGYVRINLEVATLFVNEDAKTGARPIPIIFTVPWLKAWLKVSSGDYIWTELHNPKKHLDYFAARKAFKQVAKDAGIDPKKTRLYSSRHGRNTEVSRQMTQAQQCVYAGWIQGSKMAQVYNHLSGKDVLPPLLAPFGIVLEQAQSDKQAWIEIMRLGQQHFKNLRTIEDYEAQHK